MHINFAMWRKASWQLIKMDDKKEWDALDVVSKWLIATRSAVTLVTVYSCVIAGLLAWRDGYFSWLPFIILTLGLFIAHGTNNILNDYTDYSRGVDNGNYFRAMYGVHPLVQGFFTKPQQIRWFIVSGVLATLAGIYALITTGFDPWVIALFAFGAVTLLAYTYPFKYWGLGELAIFLIWGPILIGGVYYVLAVIRGGDLSNLWNVVLAGTTYGLGVASINIGKHIDKREDDVREGHWHLPCSRRRSHGASRGPGGAGPDLCHHPLAGLRHALFHSRHAHRVPGLQVCPECHQNAEQPASCRSASGLPCLADLVLRWLFRA